MKVVFEKNALLEVIAPAASIAAIRHIEANIEGVLMECPGEQENTCRLTAYDMEKGMRTSLPCEIIEEGTILVNAQSLLMILRSLNAPEVTLETDEKLTRVTVSSGKAKFTIGIQSGERFPTVPLLSGDKNYTLPQHVLRDIIQRTIYAVNENDQRSNFTGLLFSVEGTRLLVVGCDGSRLALAHARLSEESTPASVIVPKKLLNELLKVMKDTEDEIHIAMTQKHIIFTCGAFYYFTRLIEGQYIDYMRIMPKEYKTVVTVSLNALRTAVSQAQLVAEDKFGGNDSPFVRFDVSEDKIHLSSVSAGGQIDTDIEAGLEGEPIAIGFNCRYLVDALKNAPADAECVRLGMNTPVLGMAVEKTDCSGTRGYILCEELTEEEEAGAFLDYIMPVRMNR